MKNYYKIKTSFLILLSIFIFFIITTLLYYSLIKNYWEKSIVSTIDYKTILVSYNKDLISKETAKKELLSFEEVNSIHEYSELQIPMKINDIEEQENSFYLMGSDELPLQLNAGSKLIEQEQTIICPQYFYPYETEQVWNYNYKNAIDLSQKLNKYISLSFLGSNEEEIFKLVGLYDPSLANTYGIICYTSWNNIQKLNAKYQSNIFKDSSESYYPLVVVLNNAKERNIFEKKLDPEKYISQGAVQTINTEKGNKILYILIFIIFINLFTLFIYIISSLIKKNIKYEKEERINIVIKILKQNIFSIIFCIIITLPITACINFFINQNINNNIYLKIYPQIYLIIFILNLTLSILYTIMYTKKNRRIL